MKKILAVPMFLSFAVASGANEFDKLDRAALIQRALDVQSKSYAPYSKFNVAAAALDVLIIMAKSPADYVEKTLEELLPMSFGPDSIK